MDRAVEPVSVSIMPNSTVVFFRHEALSKSGDIIALDAEAYLLSEKGFDVRLYFTGRREWFRCDGRGKVFRSHKPANGHVVVLNTLLDVRSMMQLPGLAGEKTIGRIHMNYHTRLSVTKSLGLPPSAVLDRFSYFETIDLYQKFLHSSDILVSVDPYELNQSAMYCPPPSYAPRTGPCSQSSASGVVLIGGRLTDPIKGVQRVLEELLVLKGLMPTVEIWCLSDDVESQRNTFESRGLSGVRYFNWITERTRLYSLLSSVTVFLTMPHYEPFGLMVVEALRCGVVVVSTPVGIARVLYDNLSEERFSDVGKSEGVAAELCAHLVSDYKYRVTTHNALLEILEAHYQNSSVLSGYIV